MGVGSFKIDDAGAVFFPVAVNYLLGKDDRHYFEIGAGGTFVSVSEDDSVDQVDEDSDPFSGAFGHLHLGYRMTIGRAWCRARVCESVEIQEVAVYLKKKQS